MVVFRKTVREKFNQIKFRVEKASWAPKIRIRAIYKLCFFQMILTNKLVGKNTGKKTFVEETKKTTRSTLRTSNVTLTGMAPFKLGKFLISLQPMTMSLEKI